MPRGLDHIVHAVHDLDACAEFYRRLGFTIGTRNHHPWGTDNYVVQLPDFYIEPLTVADPGKLSNDGIPRLFGHYHRTFLQHHEGLSMLVFKSADIEQDAAAFEAAGIAVSGALTFERGGRRPDGSAVKVGFSLVFARDKGAPDIGYVACRQHYPENFWNPAFQQHANGANGVAGVVLVAENPSDHHIFLSNVTGQRDLHSTSMGLRVETPLGEIQVMDPTAYRDLFGEAPPDLGNGARLAALRLAVGDIRATADVLAQGGFASETRHGRIVVGSTLAFGATLVFEQEGSGGS